MFNWGCLRKVFLHVIARAKPEAIHWK